MNQQHMATWPESSKRVRKKILTHAKDTPRSHELPYETTLEPE